MQLFTLLAILTPALATVRGMALSRRGCYSGGLSWYMKKKAAASAAVDGLCHGGDGGVSGYFAQGQSKTGCVNLSGDSHANFEVAWYGHGGLTLNDNDCKVRLKNEINACEFGGGNTAYDWFFM
jgi:hypothetical protein